MTDEKKTCGLVMPISPIDGCSAEHWGDVKRVISESIATISDPEFESRLVSEADDIGVIQKRIVQNLYTSDVVVCDVSGKNPNVMFELGMRLAFDKPTVIIKDNKTDYSFDTSVIEHVGYPRDLRFARIVAFKEELAEKVLATYEKSQSDPDHSTFLKNFGQFKVANITEETIPANEMIFEVLGDLQRQLSIIRAQQTRSSSPVRRRPPPEILIKRTIRDWLSQQDCDPESMIGNLDFYEQVESAIEAQEHYATREEFVSELEKQIKRFQARSSMP